MKLSFTITVLATVATTVVNCQELFRFKNISDGRCLSSNSAGVYGWVCSRDENMAYSLDKTPDGYVLLRHFHTGKCIKAGISNGSSAQSVTCNGTDSGQKFQLVATGQGKYRIKAVSENQCLYTGSENGDPAKSWGCKGGNDMEVGTGMEFLKEPVYQITARLMNISAGKCLYNTDDVVFGWACWNDENMAYLMEQISDSGHIMLRHLRTDMCIKAGTSSGATVLSANCDPNDSQQKFQLVHNEYGTFQIKAVEVNQILYTQPGDGASAKSCSAKSLDCLNDPGKRFLLQSVYPVEPKVVTLGDSYSSGTGIHRRGDQYDEEYGGYVAPWKLTLRSDNECWRETDDTPGPKYAASSGDMSIFLACKGAETEHVENQVHLMNSMYPVTALTDWDNSIILLTAGGNDIRTNDGKDWPDLLEHCIREGNIFKGCHDHNKNQIANWYQVESLSQQLYEELAETASKAKVRIMGYPRVMQRNPFCWSVIGIGYGEADWIDDQVDILNSILQNAVNIVKNANPNFDIKFVSMNSYITKGACASFFAREVNDKVLDGTSASHSSFHPSQRGYDKYFQAFTDNI